VPAADVARRVRRRVWTGNRPEPIRPLAHTAFAAGLGEGDAVRLRTGLGHRLLDRGEQLVLVLPDREVTFPAFTGDAVRALLSGEVRTVGSLPGVDAADQVVLVRRLLREGVLVPAAAS
jgi:hypothetical protein